MTPEEAQRMPVDQHRAFVEYQNRYAREMERAAPRRR